MNIRILALSDSDKHFSSAIAEYLKRVWSSVTVIDIKPIKNGTHEQIITKETDLLKEKIINEKAKWRYIVLLTKEGKPRATEQFVELLEKNPHLSFVIGWPYGLNEHELHNYIDYHLSMGTHTMPHGLAKLVLLEQIYRATMIIAGKQYHY